MGKRKANADPVQALGGRPGFVLAANAEEAAAGMRMLAAALRGMAENQDEETGQGHPDRGELLFISESLEGASERLYAALCEFSCDAEKEARP